MRGEYRTLLFRRRPGRRPALTRPSEAAVRRVAPCFPTGELRAGATRPGTCDAGAPAGAAKRSLAGGAPSVSPTLSSVPGLVRGCSAWAMNTGYCETMSAISAVNFTVIIEEGQLTRSYGHSRVRSRRSASLPTLCDLIFMVRCMVWCLVLVLISSSAGSLVCRFPISP